MLRPTAPRALMATLVAGPALAPAAVAEAPAPADPFAAGPAPATRFPPALGLLEPAAAAGPFAIAPAARAITPRARAAARRRARVRRVLRRMVLAGDHIARRPYTWGGGHGSFASGGYDCSGSVSYVLHAGGLLAAPEDSGQLASFGLPGPGRHVTVYANAQHALMIVDGRRFDTIAFQETGSRWSADSGSLGGYVARHPRGL